MEDAQGRPHDDAPRQVQADGRRDLPASRRARCATSDGRLKSVDIATLPYPGVATDYKPFLVTMLTVADGVGIVTENLFSGRFRYIDELRRMGADIRTEGHHAVVRGVDRLSGAQVRATDLRAGAALVLAGLVADGETVVADAHHVDRGYEDLAGKLRSLGADVERASEQLGSGPPLPTLVGPCPTDPTPELPDETRRAPRGRARRRPAGARQAHYAPRKRRDRRPGGRRRSRTASGAEAPTVGITGAPGAGQVDPRLAADRARAQRGGHRSRVIAVDPTSPFSGGAILGRPGADAGPCPRPRRVHPLDGDARTSRRARRLRCPKAVRLLAAAGIERVFIETVGVGQVEVEVASAADTTVVVVTPGWGDAVQANKAGLLEVADIFVINKADRPGARQTRLDLEQMLDMSQPGAWRPPDRRDGRVRGCGRRRAVGGDHGARAVPRRDRGARSPACGRGSNASSGGS